MTKTTPMPNKYHTLLKHVNVSRVRFRGPTQLQPAMFVLVNERGESIRKCPGLTRVLRRAFPVAELPQRRCAAVSYPRKRLPWYLVRPSSSSSGTKFVCGGTNDREHGIAVDEQLSYFVLHGGERFAMAYPQPDPCVASLLAYVKNTLRWVPICTQQHIYAPSLGGFATAIDLLCTDEATRSELHVVEIKATKRVARGADADSFERITGYGSGALRGLPLSYCSRAQLQLWAMVHTLERDCDTHIDSASVMRISPSRVDHYELNPWFLRRERALVRRISSIAAKPKKTTRR